MGKKHKCNYKNGRVHEGPGIVDGPGGPREDKVPARLSDGEAVLPWKTVQALGGPEAVARLIEETNGKAPARSGNPLVEAAGGFVDGIKGALFGKPAAPAYVSEADRLAASVAKAKALGVSGVGNAMH